MTNADKIRAMTDAELATWLGQALNGGHEWFWDWACDRCKTKHGGICTNQADDPCPGTGREIMDWLQTTAET